MASRAMEPESLAIFSVGLLFSTGGRAGFGSLLVPHWQFTPHLHASTPNVSEFLAAQRVPVTTRSAQHDLDCLRHGLDSPQRPTFAPVQRHRSADRCWQQLCCGFPDAWLLAAQQQLPDFSSFWQQLLPLVQPHAAAGRPCTGTVTAASQIRVRAAILLVIHMMSNPSLPHIAWAERLHFSLIGQSRRELQAK